jgi:myosin heavy subunit
MLETIRVRKSGYPIRLEHAKFSKQFRICSDTPLRSSLHPRDACVRILSSSVPKMLSDLLTENAREDSADEKTPNLQQSQIGNSMVFLREDYFYYLEETRKHMTGSLILSGFPFMLNSIDSHFQNVR